MCRVKKQLLGSKAVPVRAVSAASLVLAITSGTWKLSVNTDRTSVWSLTLPKEPPLCLRPVLALTDPMGSL